MKAEKASKLTIRCLSIYLLGIIGSGCLGTGLVDHWIKTETLRRPGLVRHRQAENRKKIEGLEVFDIKDFSSVVKKAKIEVAVIAVPAGTDQQVLELVIKAVMNFAPVPLKAEDDVKLKTVDLTTSLESLAFFLAGNANPGGKSLKPSRKKRRNRI